LVNLYVRLKIGKYTKTSKQNILAQRNSTSDEQKINQEGKVTGLKCSHGDRSDVPVPVAVGNEVFGVERRTKQSQVCGSMLHYIITPSYVWGQAIRIDALAERDYGRAQPLIAAR
jgi:hypothetical protein